MIRLGAAGGNGFGPLALKRQPPFHQTRHGACRGGVPQRFPPGDELVITVAFRVTVGRAGADGPGSVPGAAQQQFVDLPVGEAQRGLHGESPQADVPDGHCQVERRDLGEEVSVHLESRPAPARQASRGCGGMGLGRHYEQAHLDPRQ